MAADLPIPNYDELELGQLRTRLRTLPLDELRHLLDYERSHADRPAVTLAAEHRLSELESGAQPSGGSASGVVPGGPGIPEIPEDVNPQTSGPAMNPPSQGTPMNPAQPR